MKTQLFMLICIIFIMHITVHAQVKIGNNPMTINSASLLELEATNQGFVLPRVTILDVNSFLPLPSGLITGTLVYNTNGTITGGAGVGIYLWSGSKWLAISTNNNIASPAWSLTGNSGTSYATNFLGTTDNVSLRFRTNNTERMIIDSLGSVGIGSSAFNSSYREKLLIDYGTTTSHTLANLTGSINDYFQVNLQNKSNGTSASTDYVATADDGTDSTYYADFGINSSTYAPSVENWGGPHDAYLYSSSRNLLIGCASNNSDVIFLLGGGRIKPNTALRLKGEDGNVIVGAGEGSTNPIGNTLRGPNALGSAVNLAGGTLSLVGGSSTGTSNGADLNLTGGGTSGAGTGGNVNITGGGSASGITGAVNINANFNGATNINTGTASSSITIGGNTNNIFFPKFSTVGGFYYTSLATGQLSTTSSNMTWDSINNRLGVGTTSPGYKLSVLAASNPLYLSGVQITSTFSSDSILIINAGVVKKAPYSSLPGASIGWSLTGNSGTNSLTNFLGTTDNQSLVFKTNNQLSGKIDLPLNNLSLGYQSANSITSGTNNTFLGYQAGYGNTTGASNTGVGGIALNANTTGSNNAALGMGALGNNTTGSNNTSIGAGALRNNTTAAANVAVGASALRANITGNGNTSVGTYSMQVNTTGYSNTATGAAALGANTTGTGNTATGNAALGGNMLGINNTAVGNGAMQLNDQGNANTALGAFAMQNSNGSGGNTAVGYTALNNVTSGNYNTALGNSTGITNTTGTYNTLVGYQADVTVNNLTNATAIGYNAQASGSNSLILGNGANVGIGTSSPAYKLQVVATSNPLYLAGVQATSTYSADSVLTINAGVVKKAPTTTFTSLAWQLSGNSGTTPGTNFLGTTDNQSLVFKANNQQAGKIDLPLNNSSFGYLSANNITTGTNNIFFGYQSGNGNTSGANNTGVGSNALKSNTTSTANTATGYSALTSNTTGSDNTANGNNTLISNTTGYRNTANGSNTLYTNTTGAENSANGALVLYSNTTGNQNTANGNTALYNNTTGNSNTANGFQSLYNNTTGYYNTAYGYKSLYTNTTGNSNTAIGYNADVSAGTFSNATAIGYNALVSASNSLVLGNSANVGIGTNTPNNKLEINSATGGASGLRLTQLPAGAVLFMSSSADVAQNNNNFYFDVTNYRLGISAGTSPNSTLQVNGSIASGITTKTANYNASASDYTILCNNSSAITIFLPNASGTSGRTYVIKKTSPAAAAVTIQTAITGQTIDGISTYTLSLQYSAITVQSDGSNWYIISKM